MKPVLTTTNLRRSPAFTLVELLAVVLVILILAAISLGVARWAGQKADISQTRSDIAALELAIERYKLDTGAYPTSSVTRSSCIYFGWSGGATKVGNAEFDNSTLLYAQLTSGGKGYFSFRKNQLKLPPNVGFGLTNTGVAVVAMNLTNNGTAIVDRWATPINYYCPSPRISVVTGSTTNTTGGTFYLYSVSGGQVNSTFDLFSYGPDLSTFLPVAGTTWNNSAWATDDITNWKR